jgi:hypothetical protein
MAEIKKENRVMERLINDMAENVLQQNTEEILAEAAESYGSVDAMMGGYFELLAQVDAKQAVHIVEGTQSINVIQWPSKRKRALIEEIERRFEGELTVAARNGEEGEDDFDFMLETYIKIGVIDEEGNILE